MVETLEVAPTTEATAPDRLIASGLRFGSLLHIDQPNLVERYRKAMQAMGLTPTKLDDFWIDASGFSPQIAHEIGDPHYLDPHGVNRRFIIVSPEQRNRPLLNAAFSADVDLHKRFIVENDRAIRTLTLKDAVYGEVENLAFEVKTLDDVLDIREVKFDVHSASGILEEAFKLDALSTRFLADPDAWKDDAILDTIVAGARRCGDVRTNGILPTATEFKWPSVYRTTHFGGVYVMRAKKQTYLFGWDPVANMEMPKGVDFVNRSDAETVFKVLREKGFMEPFRPDWLRDSGVLEQRFRLLVADIVGSKAVDFDPEKMLDESTYWTKWVHTRLPLLRDDGRFQAIVKMRQTIGNDGDADGFEKSLPAHLRFMFRRAIPDVEGAWDVNRMILNWLKFDLISLYSLDKPIFYEHYETLNDRQKAFAVQYLRKYYHVEGTDLWRRKAEFRERIFGLHVI